MTNRQRQTYNNKSEDLKESKLQTAQKSGRGALESDNKLRCDAHDTVVIYSQVFETR